MQTKLAWKDPSWPQIHRKNVSVVLYYCQAALNLQSTFQVLELQEKCIVLGYSNCLQPYRQLSRKLNSSQGTLS